MVIWQKSLIINEHLKKNFYATSIDISSNKMRIGKKVCHLTTVHSIFDIRIFHKECKTLKNEGYKVTIIAQHDKNETVDRIKIIALPLAKSRIHRMFLLTLNTLRLASKERADIYHFHDPELLPIAMLLKLFSGKKVIYDMHEDYSKQILSKSYIPKIIRRPIAFLVKIIEYLFTKLFDGIITSTDAILENFFHHKKAVRVSNFPEISSYFSAKKHIDNDRDVFNLIYIGALVEIRGITQITKALDLIDSNRALKLTLCGNFYPTQYEKKVKGLEGFEKVDYFGWIEPYAILELLKRSDVGIVCFLPEPNHLRAMPNKLFEYMAAGLPVIASNFPLWVKIVEGNKCGICVDPFKPHEIAKAIEYLMEHPKIRKEMGENGRNAVLEKYNWEKESEKLIDLYRELLKSNH